MEVLKDSEETFYLLDKNFFGITKIHENASIPTKATSKSAGYDIYVLEDTLIDPGERAKIKTGIALLLPEGVHGELRARSSMSALRLDLLPGIIDQDYTGELIVVLENNRALPYEIKRNERCCQLILQKTFIPQSTGVIDIEIYQKVSQLYKHDRVGGFGSTN